MAATHQRVINKTALAIINDPNSTNRDKLQAAAILERSLRNKALARRRHSKKSRNADGQKTSLMDKNCHITDILGQSEAA
jgi:hypothetical protein